MRYEIIKFEKDNCPPCKLVDGWLDRNNVEAMHINAFEDPESARDHNVRSCPTVIVLQCNDKKCEAVEVFRTVGFKTEELETLKQYQNE